MTLRNVLVGALAVVSLAACGTSTPTADNGKIQVVASTNVWGSVIKAVGGDEVEVKALLDDPAADPHSYESKPADAALVKNAKLVVFNGGGYDDFFAKLITTEGQKKIEAFPLRDHSHAEPHERGSGRRRSRPRAERARLVRPAHRARGGRGGRERAGRTRAGQEDDLREQHRAVHREAGRAGEEGRRHRQGPQGRRDRADRALPARRDRGRRRDARGVQQGDRGGDGRRRPPRSRR